jgi:ribonuclease HIII
VLAAVPDCPRALSDQFADPALIAAALKNKGRQVLFEARTKGESDVAVAAASILARAAFVEQLQQLGDTAGVSLLKGASAAVLDAARSIVQERGEPALRQLAKAHFRTYELACGRTPPERKPWRKPGDPT